MKKTAIFTLLILLIFTLSACGPAAPTATPEATLPIPTDSADTANHLVISEVLAASATSNIYDYVELYNPTNLAIDLKGYALWYQLKEGDEEALVTQWLESTLVPPHGHFLIGQEGEDFGLIVDTTASFTMVPNRGGLILKDLDRQVVDQLGWGDASANTIEKASAPAMDKGISLERQPGGEEGNGTDTDNNLADFALNPQPSPQNSGSPLTPALEGELALIIDVPKSVSPGESFSYVLQLDNRTHQPLENLSVVVNLPEELTIADTDGDITVDGHTVTWSLDQLALAESTSASISVTAPWTYTTLKVHSIYAQAADWFLPTFHEPIITEVSGGSIPIETARTLLSTEVVIEGIATMYTDGFYAGSGVKFYIADETGGVQVYVAGAQGQLRVSIGDRVRVVGRAQLYRDTLEIVPVSASQVEILETNADEVEPLPITIAEAVNGEETLPGTLVTVEGTFARVEEFSYSYEIDMVDENGQLLTLYLDKETGITTEDIESGQQYRVTGIMEMLDGNLQLYPRLQEDFERIYPEALRITTTAQATAEPDTPFPITITVYNDTLGTVNDLQVTLPIPSGLQIVTANDGGTIQGDTVTWQIDSLEGNGGSTEVSVEAMVSGAVDSLILQDVEANAAGQEPVISSATYIFVGGTVPIWAIQGSGSRSPYSQEVVTTQGIVTAVFPDLDGFWIQETNTDTDPRTSAGLFIYTENLQTNVQPGDLVTLTGLVKEYYQETELNVTFAGNLQVVSSNNPLPAPVELDPPADPAESDAYYESLEGMLVSVSQPATVVAPSSRYGEFSFVLPYHDRTRLFQGQDNGIIIMADDGSSVTHDSQETLPYVVAAGDTVSGLTGPLSYTFSNYKIESVTTPTIVARSTPPSSLPALEDGQFSIMTWNVENLFDFVEPNPSSPPLPTVSEYKLSISKVAATIQAAGAPTLVGLQEVENIGILEDIAAHELLVEYGYIPVLIEGDDSRGIDVGYLVRGDMAEVTSVEQSPAPDGITSRPPLIVQVTITGTDLSFYAINNHFTSMSGGEAATEPRRTAQAAWNALLVEEILAEDPNALVAVMGDLNSYYNSLPITTLRESGLTHVLDRLPEEERYTYIYEGVSQVLDHILVTPALDGLIESVQIFHTNADYPISLSDDESPMHKSDHDPVIVIFNLP